MSGITGIYQFSDKDLQPELVQHMADALAHRGPDACGTWHHGPVGLGHRMLWTTPESLHERLPLVSEDGLKALTADARIDNRDELIALLKLAPPSRFIPDSELILRAYERWGVHCPEHLIGDFAFAIWDSSRQILFCARDHMGIRPFYYFKSERCFAFASEMKALFCVPEVPREINDVHIANYLAGLYDDREATSYGSIFRLPAAHALSVSPDAFHLHRYWALDPARELHFDSDEEYTAAFRAVFTEAVHCRLRSAYRVGSELSGGLDSSSVVCTARALLRREAGNSERPLHTFSCIFDEVSECDERSYIDAVLAEGGLQPHYVHPDLLSPFVDVDQFLWHVDEYVDFANYCIDWALFGAAKEAGVRILLTGVDGDTVVSYGLSYLTELARTARWYTIYKELRAFSQHPYMPLRALVQQYLVLPFVPLIARKTWRRITRVSQRVTTRGIPLKPSFARRVGFANNPQGIYKEPKTQRELHCDALSAAIDQDKMETIDRIAAAFSLELRHPFYDRRLMEFCVALPPDQKLREGWIRAILRRALSDLLPAAVCWRPGKSNLFPFFHRNLLKFERQRLDNTLLADNPLIADYINLEMLRTAYGEYLNGGEDESYPLWKTVMLELWLKRLTQDLAVRVEMQE